MNYPEIINKTAKFPKQVDDFSLAYFTLGLFDEMDELIEKIINFDLGNGTVTTNDVIAEAGDVCWYACGIANHLNLDFMSIVANRASYKENTNPFSLLGLVKKHYRDGKALDPEVVENILKNIIHKAMCNINPKIVLKTNYDKLIDRLERDVIKGDGDNR